MRLNRGGAALPIVGAGLFVLLDEVTSKQTPVPSEFIGVAFAAVIVSFIASGAPEIGKPLAWLIFLAVIYKRGPRVFRHLGFGKPATVTDLKGNRRA